MLNNWFAWFPSSKPVAREKPKPKTKYEEVLAKYEELPVKGRIASTLAVGLILGSAMTLGYGKFYALFLRRYPTHNWITPDLCAKKRWIKGVVTSVRDPDGFRLYHTPSSVWYWRYRRGIPKKLKDQTIRIRIAGIDAPELGRCGREPQPFSQEALDWMKKKVLGKAVCCQLLERDRYGRIVAAVVLPEEFKHWFSNPRGGTPLANEMLRAGLAVTYTEPGAVYGHGGLKEHLSIEAEARRKRRGLWVNGPNIETPSEYRRRHRSGTASESPEEVDLEDAEDAEDAETSDSGEVVDAEKKSTGRVQSLSKSSGPDSKT